MDTQVLFASLARYRKILVTGPQRSGTTIVSRILAAESGYRCVDERDFGWRDIDRFEALVAEDDRMVIQCPGLSHTIERWASPDHLIVFMHRNPADIMASERRVRWGSGRYQKRLYRHTVPYLRHWLTPVSVLKYLHWHFVQKAQVPHSVDLPYESLVSHPLWVSQDRRAGFTAKQTAPDDASGA